MNQPDGEFVILTPAVGILNMHYAREIPSASCDSLTTLLTDHLMTFRRVGRQTTLYFIATGIYFAFAVIVITWLACVLAGWFGGDRLIVATLLTIVLAVAVRPLIEMGESALQRAIAQNMFRYRENFSQFTRERITCTLVFPGLANIDKGLVSVLAPIGTALIGYCVGNTVEWEVPAGKTRFRIEEILYQPEAAAHDQK